MTIAYHVFQIYHNFYICVERWRNVFPCKRLKTYCNTFILLECKRTDSNEVTNVVRETSKQETTRR